MLLDPVFKGSLKKKTSETAVTSRPWSRERWAAVDWGAATWKPWGRYCILGVLSSYPGLSPPLPTIIFWSFYINVKVLAARNPLNSEFRMGLPSIHLIFFSISPLCCPHWDGRFTDIKEIKGLLHFPIHLLAKAAVFPVLHVRGLLPSHVLKNGD